MIEIRHRDTLAVIYRSETATAIAEALAEAVKAGANLYGATLSGANLERANLYGATLSGATLERANLYGATLDADFPFWKFRIVAEGTITGWKKIRGGKLLRLEIPADARRLNAPGSRKCRAEYAIVAAAYDGEGELLTEPGELRSSHNSDFMYTVGAECRPDRFEEDERQECAPGIHFFITVEEAKAYQV